MPEPAALLGASLVLLCVTCLAGIVCVVKGVRWDNDRGEPGSPAHGSLTELWSARLLETAPAPALEQHASFAHPEDEDPSEPTDTTPPPRER